MIERRSGGLGMYSHRPLSSSFLGLPYRIPNINHKKELLGGLWAVVVNVRVLETWGLVVPSLRPYRCLGFRV